MAVSGSQLNKDTVKLTLFTKLIEKTVPGLERVAIEVSDDQPDDDGYWFRKLRSIHLEIR